MSTGRTFSPLAWTATRYLVSPSETLTPIPSAIDSALRAAHGSANRATLRASSVARFGSSAGAATTTTFAAEYSSLQQITTDDVPFGQLATNYSSWQSDAGIVGQVDASWRNALFATGGLRVERTDGLAATNGLVSLPMIGGAAVHDFGSVTTKLHASYGKGIRPAGTALRASWLERQSLTQRNVAPEEQSGLEVGVDAFVGHSFAVHLTRFDQYAYNLIQPVAVASSMTPSPADDGSMRLMYALQNVGGITNRGWELESAVFAGQLSLSGTLSFVDSRVRQLAFGYRGDLQPGDRMLGVPAVMGGLTSTWTARRWSASLTASRASDWINYDGLALASASSTAASSNCGRFAAQLLALVRRRHAHRRVCVTTPVRRLHRAGHGSESSRRPARRTRQCHCRTRPDTDGRVASEVLGGATG